jgi:MFS family permease
MDFDQMLETWRAQNTVPQYEVNRDALRQALHTEEVRVRQELRTGRRALWIISIVATGMAVWAGSWIALTIANGWPSVYAIAAGVTLAMIALGVGALWVSRKQEPERNFGNTLEQEVRRSLALVDYQLSDTRRFSVFMPSFVGATVLFFWTVVSSQHNPDSSGDGWSWFTLWFVGLLGWTYYQGHKALRQGKAKLELRQRHLRELLAALNVRE